MAAWTLDRVYDFDGHRVRYRILGEGRPVVLVHGTPWSSYNMRHLARGLAHGYRVYAFDLLGYGESDMPDADVSLGVQNRLLAALLEHWQLERPVVIGHDYGGATALRTALLEGWAFERMVLIDPVAVAPWGSAFFRQVREHQAAFAGLPEPIHEAVVRAYAQSAAYRPLAAEVLDATVAPWLSAAGRAAFYRQMAQADQAYTDAVQSRYGELRQPALIIWGQQDSWIPLDRGYVLHGLLPESRLRLIPQAGHLVIEERPNLLTGIIELFLMEDAAPDPR